MAVLTTSEKRRLNRALPVLNKLQIAERLANLETDGTITSGLSGTVTNLDLGDSTTPTAGSMDIFPAASGGANDKLTMTALTNGGNRGLGIVNRAMGQATTLAYPDPGAATGEFVLTNSAHQLIVNANGSDRTMSLAGNVSFAGAVTLAGALTTAAAVTFAGANALTVNVPAGGSNITLPASGTLATATGAETGTTSDTFTVNNDGNGAVISSSGLTGTRTYTFPDANGVVVTEAGTQSLTNKTLAGASLSGTLANTNVTVTGTWVDLGAVTTVDINGGTLDNVVIGGATPAAAAVTTLDASGACTFGGGYGSTGVTVSAAGNIQANGTLTVDSTSTLTGNVTIGNGYAGTGSTLAAAGTGQFKGALTTDGALTADSAAIGGGYGSTGVSISNAGVIEANGAITSDGAVTGATFVAADATTPTISTAAGKTNTGGVKVNGKTSGSATFTTADETAQDVNLAFAAQTSGAATCTIPDMAGSAKYVTFGDSTGKLQAAGTANYAASGDASIGIPFVLTFATTATGTTSSAAVPTGRKLRVLDAWGVMTGAGAAGDTVKLANSGGGDITEAVDLSAKADTETFRFATINDAQWEVAAAATLNCTNASDAAVTVTALCVYAAA
jgi:hypothetical protein